MDEQRRLALMALGLVEATARGDAEAESLLVDGFASVEEAVAGHGYLAGFVVELLRQQRQERIDETLAHVRRRIASP